MPTIIKRTDRERHYENDRRAEEIIAPERDAPSGPCPFRATEWCSGDDCVLWNDDLAACGLSPVSLQLIVKTAFTDAAAEIMRAIGDDLK